MTPHRAITVILGSLCAGTAWATPPTFTGVGDLSGGAFESSLWRVSADGTTPVGYSIGSAGYRAVRWRAATGLADLGSLNGQGSEAKGVSGDGNIVAGDGDWAGFSQPMRWTSGGGMQGLGFLSGGYTGLAYDLSDAGDVVVGMTNTASTHNNAFRWTQATGMQSLGTLPGHDSSLAWAISGDGSTIGGVSVSSVTGNSSPFRWTAATGMVSLGNFGASSTDVTAISNDGSVISGMGSVTGGLVALRWTAGTGWVGLGDLPGGQVASRAFGISGDGSVIVGRGYTALGQEAFYWTAAGGMVNLKTMLLSMGLTDVDNWQLTQAVDVSSDGTVIVGNGIDPLGRQQGWIATIPAPSGLLPVSALLFLGVRRRRPI